MIRLRARGIYLHLIGHEELCQANVWVARGFVSWILPLLLLLIVSSACSEDGTPFKEMVEHGFYAYALPENTVRERGWHVAEVDKPNWEAHCLPGPSASWNPITISYLGEIEEQQLTIRISDQDRVWVRERDTDTVPVRLEYVPERTGFVYHDSGQSPVKFVDKFGNDVVVDADLPIKEKLELISSLQYVGPEASELVNPWSVEWCEQR